MPEPIRTPLLVVGAGPCGLAVGVAARQAGIGCVLLDRRTIVSAIERYPLSMTFFSTPEKIEIGDIPFITSQDKPTRRDGLIYYRRVAEHFGLDVRPGQEVVDLTRDGDGWLVDVRRRHDALAYRAEGIVVATGYYDNPNPLRVPGEDLPHVSHYFTEGHAHWHQRVVIVGAGNSAVDAALECWRAGAQVTLVHRGPDLHSSIKAWVRPDINNRLKEGSIQARWSSHVVAITPTDVEIRHADTGRTECLPADSVLLMTGYHADATLLLRAGVPVDPRTGVAAFDEGSMATPVRGIYLAGVVAGGCDDNRLFIENSRHHGELIMRHFMAQRRLGG